MAEFKRVLPGDALRIPAGTYNAMLDAAEAHRRQQSSVRAGRHEEYRDLDVVLVKNSTGAAVPRFGILGFSLPVITAANNLSEFLNRPALLGEVPLAHHGSRFVITLEPIPSLAIGRAAISGIVPVKVLSQSEPVTHAGIWPGFTDQLASHTGSTQVLYREPGAGVAVWALVRLGPAAETSITLEIVSSQGDHLICQVPGVAGATFNVAKPNFLRNYATWPEFPGVTFGSYSADATIRQANDLAGTEDQFLLPKYASGQLIEALRASKTNVTVNNVELSLIDANVEGRYWVAEVEVV